MSVTAVIVNYNSGDWLARCLRSVLSLPEMDRVVVVDNASQDDSVARIKSLLTEHESRLELIQNVDNRGFAAANNQVLQGLLNSAASGNDYALLLNPDCEMKAGVLPAMLTHFEQQESMGMAGCVINNEDGSIQATCRRHFPTPKTALIRMLQLHRLRLKSLPDFDLGKQALPDNLQFVEAISGAFMLVRLSAMQEVGLLDEGYFMHCEDLDWCKRFHNKNWKIGFVPEVSVIHAKGVSSNSRPVRVLWTLHRGMLRFFDKFYYQQYPFYVRWSVKSGVYLSFLGRAGLAYVRRFLT